MSTPRSTPRGPAEKAGIIGERAYKGAVVSALLIPVLQYVLLEFYNVMQSLPTTGGPFLDEAQFVFQSGMAALVLLPVVSTIGSIILSYAFAGWPGVGLYWMMSMAASSMLGASLTAALIFVTGVFLFFLAAAVKMYLEGRNNRNRPVRRL